jgi:hypothetical protein
MMGRPTNALRMEGQGPAVWRTHAAGAAGVALEDTFVAQRLDLRRIPRKIPKNWRNQRSQKSQKIQRNQRSQKSQKSCQRMQPSGK